ncbi:trypsin-like cysteine/serine peptidase domain-containing protein [Umbelopsis sp. PMI_123]|nr:trypsin-like cysteine/serine peptidase domain-containing protein [Umbelopsis sp. PMI_123]
MCVYILLCYVYIFLLGYVQAIQNGTIVQDGTLYPFYVAIGNPRLCGGTFLSFNPTWVLTAAHCLVNVSTTSFDSYYIMYGNTTRSTSHLATIESWVIHPQYNLNNSNYDYDIAVVKFRNNSIIASSGVSRIPLLSNAATIAVGEQSWIMGYGFTSIGGTESSSLRVINETISYVDSDASDLIKANTAPYSGVCHGDSGGPLVVQQDGIWKVAGVTSRILNAYDPIPSSPTCAISYNEMQQSQDGYVNVAFQLNWISNVTDLTIAQLTAMPSGVNNNTSASSPDNEGYHTTNSAVHGPSPNILTLPYVTLFLYGLLLALG